MSIPRFSYVPGSDQIVRTAECLQCGETFSWTEASRRRFCNRCRVLRKKTSDASKPERLSTSRAFDDAPNIGRAVGFDCLHLPERCEQKQCRHHLGTDIGTPDCAVKVANEHIGGVELVHIGRWLGVSRERVRQIEAGAIAVIRRT
jgi:hypothetical protein